MSQNFIKKLINEKCELIRKLKFLVSIFKNFVKMFA